MACSRGFYVTLVLALLGDAFCIPVGERLPGNHIDQEDDIQAWLESYGVNKPRDLESANSDVRVAREDGKSMTAGDSNEGESRVQSTTMRPDYATPVNDDDDDDDDFDTMNTAPSSGGGSNILSLLRLATALFPSSSGSNQFMRLLRRYFRNQLNTNVPIFNAIPNYPPPYNPTTLFLRRNDVDVTENRVDIDDIKGLQPPLFQRQETDEDSNGDNGTDEDSDSDNGTDEESDENNAAESVEVDNGNGNDIGNGNSNGNASKQKSASAENDKVNGDNNSDYSDEPPEGDGQGGGILGILAGLSGGEDGSDLGTLLATVSGIVANLSGDGFDLNALIGSGIGLFAGLLSEGEENPGAVIASYLLTSLDTITGGGSKNNGAFFGKFLSKLIRGTSAGGDPDASLEEGKEPEKDSAGFLGSFLMALLGEMSKGSSKSSSCGSSCGHPGEE